MMPTILETRVVTGTGGGPDKTILNTPRFLEPYGYRTLCAFFHPPDDPGFETLRQRARDAQAPLIGLPDRGAADLKLVRRLVQLCREENVSVWHGHDYKSNALGLLVRRFHPMRLITTVHGWVLHSLKTRLYFHIDRWCLRHYEHVLCVSTDLQQECLSAGVPAERCSLLENAIDLPHYERRRSRDEAKRALGLPTNRPLIAAVGRLSPEKNFPLLIRSARRLIRDGRPVSLAIAGDGSLREELESLISALGLQECVRLLGFQSDPRVVYEAADAVALSSDREGLPNVLLEAMAMRIPVVSTRVAGVPRLIEHEKNGLLVACGDEAGLARAIGRLLGDHELQQTLGANGRTTIESRYSFDVRMKSVAALYDSLKLCAS